MKSAFAIFVVILSVPAYADFFFCEAEKQVLIELTPFGAGMAGAGESSDTFIVTGQRVKKTDDEKFDLSNCKSSKYDDEIQCEYQDGETFISFWMSRFLGFTFREQYRSSLTGNDTHYIVTGQCKEFSE